MNDPISEALRFFTILHCVAARRRGKAVTRRQLAEACGCCTRTIQRAIDRLKTASVPIFWNDSEQSYVLPDSAPTCLPDFCEEAVAEGRHAWRKDRSHDGKWRQVG